MATQTHKFFYSHGLVCEHSLVAHLLDPYDSPVHGVGVVLTAISKTTQPNVIWQTTLRPVLFRLANTFPW